MIHRSLGIGLAALVLVAACDDDSTDQTVENVRAIKTFQVVEPAGFETRTYSGTLAASDSSALSFAVPGTIESVNVSQGDRVTKGQILAVLDREPFELDVRSAQAELTNAEALYTEKTAEVTRQRQLFEKGWVARAALDQAEAAYEGAQAQLDYARSALSIAERNLRHTELAAPFDGTVAERDVEPFQEVSTGMPVLQVNSAGAMEVEVSVADAVVSRINAGASMAVDVLTVPDCGCPARITEIGSVSGSANSVTVTAVLLDPPPSLLPGMAAEVRVRLGQAESDAGYLVPLTAIAAGDDAAKGYVFVYDAAEKVVHKRAIGSGSGVSGNLVAVTGSVAAGDVIASAGVSFLRDGQRVKLLGE